MNIDMQDYWYSPGYVIYMDAELIKTYGQEIIDRDTLFQRVGEMKATAIMLLGLNKAFGTHFFMQSSKNAFPDVWTLYQEGAPGKNVDTKYQTVEVATYETHSSMEVADFILSSKLINPKKAYDEETIILCYIRKAGTFIDFNLLYQKLKQNKFKPSRVFVLGNKIGNPQIFLLSQVWPVIHHEEVDYVKRTKSYPLPYRMFFSRMSSTGIVQKEDKIETRTEDEEGKPIEPLELNVTKFTVTKDWRNHFKPREALRDTTEPTDFEIKFLEAFTKYEGLKDKPLFSDYFSTYGEKFNRYREIANRIRGTKPRYDRFQDEFEKRTRVV